MSLVDYARSGGFPPPDDERLRVDDDGRYVLVRTNGSPRVGRFEGHLDEAALARLRALVAAVASSGEAFGAAIPDAAFEQVVAGPARLVFAGSRPDEPWAALVAELRRLTDDLATAPATGLVLKPGATMARLVVSGDEPVELDLGGLRGQAVTFEPGGALAERAGVQGPVERGAEQWRTLRAGEYVDLAYVPVPASVDGGRLQVEVVVPARRDGSLVRYRLLAVLPAPS